MTGPIDDDGALRAALNHLPLVTGVDADELATGAIRRGRQRRQRRRGVVASASGLAALALAVPALAATAHTDERPADVATTGEVHDGDGPGVVGDDPRIDEPDHDAPDPTVPKEEPGEPEHGDDEPANEQPRDEPRDDPRDAPPVEEPGHESTPPTTEKPHEAPPKETPHELEYETLELGCGRGSGEEAGGVVCEVSLSERPDFAAYRLLRVRADQPDAGWVVAKTWGQRTMPERPWPDIRFFDPAGSLEHPWYYKVVVVDAEGHVIGSSNQVTVPLPDGPPPGGDGGVEP